MTNPVSNPHNPDLTGRYEIRVRGRLDTRWSAWFDGHVLVALPDGTTRIEAQALDQAALHGLLRLIRDAGLDLVSIARIDRVDGVGGTEMAR